MAANRARGVEVRAGIRAACVRMDPALVRAATAQGSVAASSTKTNPPEARVFAAGSLTESWYTRPSFMASRGCRSAYEITCPQVVVFGGGDGILVGGVPRRPHPKSSMVVVRLPSGGPPPTARYDGGSALRIRGIASDV